MYSRLVDIELIWLSKTDIEKLFVASLLQRSQALHEEDVIAKNNEIRRVNAYRTFVWNLLIRSDWQRDNMIEALNSKNAKLEDAVARQLTAKVSIFSI